jgi:DNA-binding MarR family transcriptional regulator
MHFTGRTVNLLGAAALAVTDLALAGAMRAADISASGAAALVVLSGTPDLTITELGRRVGLTQSAAARMVDSLEADNLAERHRGPGRWVSVHLTSPGRQAVRELLAARGAPLAEVIAALDHDEQEALAGLLAKLLSRLHEVVGNAELMCRLCDRGACTTDATCPVGEAEREQGG